MNKSNQQITGILNFKESYDEQLHVSYLVSFQEHILVMKNIFDNQNIIEIALKYRKKLSQDKFIVLACENNVSWSHKQIKFLSLHKIIIAQSHASNTRAKALKEMSEILMMRSS